MVLGFLIKFLIQSVTAKELGKAEKTTVCL